MLSADTLQASQVDACLALRRPAASATPEPDVGSDPKAGGEQTTDGEDEEGIASIGPPPLAVVSALLAASSPSLQRAGAALAAAACADAANATILIKMKVLPTLVALAKEGAVEAAARAAIASMCAAIPSALLWHTGGLPMAVSIADGFWAVTRNTEMLAVEDLAKSNTGPEVLVVDCQSDQELAELVTASREIVSASANAGASTGEVAAALARYVCEQLGGVIKYEQYEKFDEPSAELSKLRAELSSRVVPLGSLSVGSVRHRAILYKVLADQCDGLRCSLDVGLCIRGAHAHHAWNTMLIDGEVVVVDVRRRAPAKLFFSQFDLPVLAVVVLEAE